MKNIVLIGMPGCGKSTVGVLLAKSLGYDFLDTDLLIQRRAGCRLQEIIDEQGMSSFLAAEEDVLCSVDVRGTVIATGGSAVYSERGMRRLTEHGVTVWLRADLSTLEARLGDFAARGIAGANANNLAAIFAEREPLYAHYAQITVNCADGLVGVEETRRRLVEELSAHRMLWEK